MRLQYGMVFQRNNNDTYPAITGCDNFLVYV